MSGRNFYSDEDEDDVDDVFGDDEDQFSSQDLERRLFCARVGIAECVVRVVRVTLEDIFQRLNQVSEGDFLIEKRSMVKALIKKDQLLKELLQL